MYNVWLLFQFLLLNILINPYRFLLWHLHMVLPRLIISNSLKMPKLLLHLILPMVIFLFLLLWVVYVIYDDNDMLQMFLLFHHLLLMGYLILMWNLDFLLCLTYLKGYLYVLTLLCKINLPFLKMINHVMLKNSFILYYFSLLYFILCFCLFV